MKHWWKIYQKWIKNQSKNRSWWLLGGSWDLLNPKMAPRTQKWRQKSKFWPPLGGHVEDQNPHKIDLEAFQKAAIFLIGFGVGFYWHLVPTWLQLGSQNPFKIDPSWIKNWVRMLIFFCLIFDQQEAIWLIFWSTWPSTWRSNTSKNRSRGFQNQPKRESKTWCKMAWNLEPSWSDFWWILGPIN